MGALSALGMRLGWTSAAAGPKFIESLSCAAAAVESQVDLESLNALRGGRSARNRYQVGTGVYALPIQGGTLGVFAQIGGTYFVWTFCRD